MAILKPNTVKDGIISRLRENFPSIVLYDEPITRPLFPHFFIFQLTTSFRADNYNHWFIDYFGTVRFRVADQPELINNLNEQLDYMALQLSWVFKELIEFEGVKFRITQSQPAEKVEGVLHWFWNTTIRVTREQAETVKQTKLEYKINLQEAN